MDIIFDLDGTLANLDHRLDFVRTQPKNWAAFNRAIPFDEPVLAVVYLLQELAKNPKNRIIICSGRSSDTRNDTVRWLEENGIWQHISAMYMRSEGDYRSDDVIKKELLHELSTDGYVPLMVFDDRPQVVRMWREYGLFVFDCNQSGKEF